jgi:hypothetical protein
VSWLRSQTRQGHIGSVCRIIARGRYESTLHVAFCGIQTVRLISNGYEAYKLTQKRAEENRLAGVVQTAQFAIFMFLAAILGRWLAR